ncbi:MAG: hypothetical protein WBM50_07200 [Acidimicrobiales bacterium]
MIQLLQTGAGGARSTGPSNLLRRCREGVEHRERPASLLTVLSPAPLLRDAAVDIHDAFDRGQPVLHGADGDAAPDRRGPVAAA